MHHRKLPFLSFAWMILSALHCHAQTMDKPVVTETGQMIVCEATPRIFPFVWRFPPQELTAKSLAKSKINSAVAVVKEVLSHYPAGFLKKYLKTIYILDEIKEEGIEIGGTVWWLEGIVYLSNGVGSAEWLREVLNHEIGHIVLVHPDSNFWGRDWAALNAPCFRYGKGGFEAIKANHQDTTPKSVHYAQGFVSEYAKSAVAEDFASLSEGLMSGDKEFWAAVDKSPILAKKVAYAIKTYGSLDAAFTEAYFRNLPNSTKIPDITQYKEGEFVTFPYGGKVIFPSTKKDAPFVVKVQPRAKVTYSAATQFVIFGPPTITLFPNGGTYQPKTGAPVPIPKGSRLLKYEDGTYEIERISDKP